MSKKKSPKELRERARQLIEKARQEQIKRYQKVGRLVEEEMLSKNFNVENLNQFKTKIKKILNE